MMFRANFFNFSAKQVIVSSIVTLFLLSYIIRLIFMAIIVRYEIFSLHAPGEIGNR